MAYAFDLYGWYAGIVADGAPRSTAVVPGNLSLTTTPGQLRANFTGYVWLVVPYTEPAAPVEPIPAARHITKLAFRNRFTMPEKVALELACLDDPSASGPARQQSAALRATLADTAAATYIDLDRADTRTGVQSLEALGLLGAGRALIILDADISDDEKPVEVA